MAEDRSQGDLTGTLTNPGPDVDVPSSSGEPATPVPDEDQYAGKSLDDLKKMHKDMLKTVGTQSEELGQLRNFIGRVGMFFKVDGDQVTLNDDILKKYAEVQGWIPKSETTNGKPEIPASEGNEVFEKDERSTIQDMIRQEIQNAFKSNFEPLQQQFISSQHQQWMERVSQKHPDFMKMRTKVADFLNKSGFRVNSADDLEKAYIATKALSGEMMDKRQAEAHIQELEKTLTTLTPGTRGAMKDPNEMSNEELLGIEVADTPEKRAMEALTGKTYFQD
jgi:hypothetical protein